jgi:DNA-binding GntR family transcriptional regulator
MKALKYKNIQNYLKEKIQKGEYKVGDYLPSENELCREFSITRTTARRALDELLKEGFIVKHPGKGSCIRERRLSLGLLRLKGFSEAVGKNVNTVFIQKPVSGLWAGEIILPVEDSDKNSPCYYFERLRFVGDIPVMHEKNWFSATALPAFTETEFVEGSFFKTLSQNYFIEIIGATQELRAELAGDKNAGLLKLKKQSPLLHISIKFFTSTSKLNIYSELYCNTTNYPVGNSHFL